MIMGEKRAYKPRKPGGGRKKLKPEYDAGKNLKEQLDAMSRNDFEMSICMYKASFNSRKLTQNDICGIILIGKAYTRRKA